MSQAALEEHVDHLLRELLLPRNRARLEAYRFRGSTNRVYKIPVSEGSQDFIIVKLMPSRITLIKKRVKRLVRNFIYGEHYVTLGGKRVAQELANTREWLMEGIPVPSVVEISLPGVRVFKGLPHPTLFTIFSNPDISEETKLQALAAVVRSLSQQHRIAWEKGRQSLVHGDPGPWNIMFDLDRMQTYWFDLEHPAAYPRMTVEDLMVRALRIFTYGVLDHLGRRGDDVLTVIAENYALDFVLHRLIEDMEARRGSLLLQTAEAVGLKRGSAQRRRYIAAQLAWAVHRRDLLSGKWALPVRG